MSKTFCRCQFPTETVVDRVAVCLSCGGEIPVKAEPKGDSISGEDLDTLRRKLSDLRRDFNRKVDAVFAEIETLTKRQAS